MPFSGPIYNQRGSSLLLGLALASESSNDISLGPVRSSAEGSGWTAEADAFFRRTRWPLSQSLHRSLVDSLWPLSVIRNADTVRREMYI
ncbi:hypothetical protein FOZ62_017040 [Perkinsus olseni]|uniref:Uncharacterized protein n=1 Tax=Perkinsus olseni TaxID=32597 RepID=A0A7J6U7J8_PEROL|nr:hypothetical protein FOZ62_017040 [Perkinsus olseni]